MQVEEAVEGMKASGIVKEPVDGMKALVKKVERLGWASNGW